MKRFTILNDRIRQNAIMAIMEADPRSTVTIGPEKRRSTQNACFHAICSDLARSHLIWDGKRRSLEEWKALLVSAHSKAIGSDGELVRGIEGELVAIRESTASMSVSRAASLIEYATAFCVGHGVDLREARDGGFIAANDERAA